MGSLPEYIKQPSKRHRNPLGQVSGDNRFGRGAACCANATSTTEPPTITSNEQPSMPPEQAILGRLAARRAGLFFAAPLVFALLISPVRASTPPIPVEPRFGAVE